MSVSVTYPERFPVGSERLREDPGPCMLRKKIEIVISMMRDSLFKAIFFHSL
jgi:hypothetical protein